MNFTTHQQAFFNTPSIICENYKRRRPRRERWKNWSCTTNWPLRFAVLHICHRSNNQIPGEDLNHPLEDMPAIEKLLIYTDNTSGIDIEFLSKLLSVPIDRFSYSLRWIQNRFHFLPPLFLPLYQKSTRIHHLWRQPSTE